MQACTRPELKLMFAIPNGGQRHIAVANKLRQEGVKAGIPDLMLAVGRGPYHGLFIEMKAGKNKPTAKQQEWIESLRRQLYFVEVCRSFDEARLLIEWYLDEIENE